MDGAEAAEVLADPVEFEEAARRSSPLLPEAQAVGDPRPDAGRAVHHDHQQGETVEDLLQAGDVEDLAEVGEDLAGPVSTTAPTIG